VTFVAAATLLAFEEPSWDWIRTANGVPNVGLLPLFTEVIASFVGPVIVTVNGADALLPLGLVFRLATMV
jgi:hypothetical protein